MKPISNNLNQYPTLIIGGGPVGMAFAYQLKKGEVPLIGVTSRQKKKAFLIAKKLNLKPCTDYTHLIPKAKLILIAVKDEAIAEVAQSICKSKELNPGTFLAHFSGALNSEILKEKNNATFAFSLHPLQSFASREKGPHVEAIPFIFEGDKEAIPLAKELANLFKGEFIIIEKNAKILYHLAATMASNFLVTLAFISSKLNEKAKIPTQKSLSILIPLLKGTIKNLEEFGLPRALTGPLQRGDLRTIQKHLNTLRQISRDWLNLYTVLSFETLKVAQKKGLPSEKINALEKLLRSYQ